MQNTPGEMLREIIKAKRIKGHEAGVQIGLAHPTIARILTNACSVTARSALLLESWHPEVAAERWIAAQGAYDLQKARNQLSLEGIETALSKISGELQELINDE